MMRQRVSQALAKNAPPAQVAVPQRNCACGQRTEGKAECEECRKESETFRRRSAPPSAPPAPPEPPPFGMTRFGQDLSGVRANAGSGQPLPSPVRSALEQSFRAPLSSVRVHTDSAAAHKTREQRAEAITLGEEIYFARGRYQPHAPRGRHLLAHEVAHVLQMRAPGPASPLAAVEAEAEGLAGKSLAGAPLPVVRHAGGRQPLRKESTAREVIEDELDDVFFGIENAWPLIRKESATEREALRDDADLERRIRERASPMDLLKTYLLLTYGDEASFPSHYKAFIEATDMWGTHEQRIYAILRGVLEAQRREMRNMPGVAEVIEDEMSGKERVLANKLLFESEEWTRRTAESSETPSVHLEPDRRFLLILEVRKSFAVLQDLLVKAAQREGDGTILRDSSLWAEIADQFAPEEVWYLRMITQHVTRSEFPTIDTMTKAPVKEIWDAVAPTGTDEDKLIETLRNVGQATSFLKNMSHVRNPNPAEDLKADPWLVPMLEEELSGKDLKRALEAVAAKPGNKPRLRDDLEDAIDDRDMPRIRRLLGDPKLSASELSSLENDPVILDEMGEELSGAELCETSLLLRYGHGGFPEPVQGFLPFFQKKPIDVDGAVRYLRKLPDKDRVGLHDERGVYYMLIYSSLPVRDVGRLLAALRSSEKEYQIQGSEGTHFTQVEKIKARLPVSFTSSEARVSIQFNIDTHLLPSNYKLDSGLIEQWTAAIDKAWNHKYRVRSGHQSLALVFAPFMAVGMAQPDKTIYLEDAKGRSWAENNEMYLFLQGTSGDSTLPPETVAHEFGHLLGNPDEYWLTPDSYKDLTGTPAIQPPPRGGQSVMKSIMGEAGPYDVQDRHLKPTLQIINAVRDKQRYPEDFKLEKG